MGHGHRRWLPSNGRTPPTNSIANQCSGCLRGDSTEPGSIGLARVGAADNKIGTGPFGGTIPATSGLRRVRATVQLWTVPE